jgi:hypothetical protein
LDATSAVASDPNPIPQPHVADEPGRRAAITRLSDDVTRFYPGVIHRNVIRANDETAVSKIENRKRGESRRDIAAAASLDPFATILP